MPDDFDPKELPTSPDHGVPCPACDAEGSRLVDIGEEPTTRIRKVRRLCDECWGKKRLTREQLARYLARVG